MPWLTFGEPGFITRLHQAQTSVGNLRAALTIFFMIGSLDRATSAFVHWRDPGGRRGTEFFGEPGPPESVVLEVCVQILRLSG